MSHCQALIEKAFDNRANLTRDSVDKPTQEAIAEVIEQLNQGKLRVAEKRQGQWLTHAWIKKAILLFFKITENQPMEAGCLHFYDKVPLKFQKEDLAAAGVRIVPTAIARYGSYIAPNTVLMPSYINIGAYVDSGTLVDTWATVGSGAQIGKNVHLSGGVGIGGVLEPVQANPTIIEDNCFIGARSEIVEGVIVEEGAVISMGVYLGQSTRIYHRESGEIFYGRVPAGSVVVPGSLPDPTGKYSLYCAIIVKQVDATTRHKVSLNELLRDDSYVCRGTH